MIRARIVRGPIVQGGSVVDGRELVIWLYPSLQLAAGGMLSAETIFRHGFLPATQREIDELRDDEA